MNNKRLSQVEDIAIDVLRKNDCLELPIDVFCIARKEGINTVEHEFGEDIYGILVLKDSKYTIGYSKNNVPVRQRFTIAHELGHYFLGHNKDGLKIDTLSKNYSSVATVFLRSNESSSGEILQEREANAFAAALLMPQSLLIKKFEESRFNFDINKLAEDFNVSTQAMAYRLSNLGLLDNVPF
jgi:Zn-dependent peptidase ImmA (M78 family)